MPENDRDGKEKIERQPPLDLLIYDYTSVSYLSITAR